MQRHILLVTIDSLRADFVGCYKRRQIATPNLDAFAATSVRFDHHLSSLSTTLPSHCSLLTGCTPAVHGVHWNGITTPRRRTTLAELAKTHGYATAAVTSWGGFKNQGVYGFEDVYSEGGAGADENRGDYTLQRVEEWIDRTDASKPQLLWVHLIDPHTPDNCPEPFPQTYEGEVQFVDGIVGRLVEAWDDTFGAEKSIAIITADHGELFGEQGYFGHGPIQHARCHEVPFVGGGSGRGEAG